MSSSSTTRPEGTYRCFVPNQGTGADIKYGGNVESAKKVGESIGRKALELGIKEVVFDRNGFKYHGRVKALADGAREAGLIF